MEYGAGLHVPQHLRLFKQSILGWLSIRLGLFNINMCSVNVLCESCRENVCQSFRNSYFSACKQTNTQEQVIEIETFQLSVQYPKDHNAYLEHIIFILSKFIFRYVY